MNPNPLKAKYATKVISGTIITVKKVDKVVAMNSNILSLPCISLFAVLLNIFL